MRKLSVVAACVAIYAVFASTVSASEPDLAKADWSVNSPHNLATNPPSDPAVLMLIEKLNGLEGAHLHLCSSQFADLRHSGNLSLVVTWSDGRFCGAEIIDKTTSGLEVYYTDSSDTDNFVELRDLDGNGKLELVARTELTFYRGIHYCQATWLVIYAWTGNEYDDVSSKYRPFYEQRLDSLNKEIAALSSASEQMQAPAVNEEPAPEPTTTRHIKLAPLRTDADLPPSEAPSPTATPAPKLDLGSADCVKAEAAKIERFLGSPDAGMNAAIGWANRENRWTRDFAGDVLFDIGTSEAITYLKTLSKDSDPMVAGSAKTHLRVLAKGGRQHKIEKREDLPP